MTDKQPDGRTSVFISAERSGRDDYDRFVEGLVTILASFGVRGRNIHLSENSPKSNLIASRSALQECSGIIVVAFPRKSLGSGEDRPASARKRVIPWAKLPSAWNQVEAAMAYQLELPIFVIAEKEFYREGLLQGNFEWRILEVDIEPKTLDDPELRNMLQNWCQTLPQSGKRRFLRSKIDLDITVSDLIGLMTPRLVAFLVGCMAAVFAAGVGVNAYFKGH